MKLNTALKLSALAVALASTSAFAATLNTSELGNDVWTDPRAPQVGNVDQADYQYVDLGSKAKPTAFNPNEEGNGSNELAMLYTGTNLDGDEVDVYVIKGNNYTIEGSTLVPFTGELGEFVHGGTANNYLEGTVENEAVVKRIDSNTVTYGEEKSTNDQGITLDLAVTDSQGNADPKLGLQSEAAGTPVVESKSVSLGILSTDEDNNNEYGVIAKSENSEGEKFTKLTVDGIETTGTIKINGVDVAKDLAAATTTANAAQTTATEAKTVADVANTTANAAQTTATEAKTVANAANTTANAAQTTATEAKTVANAAQTTATEAKTVANAAQTTATEAKDLAETADTKATTALTAVQDIDSKFVQVGSRVDQLNKRVDDVEKTAYRGVAIALAAQQNVPNIKPGQFAVFGGVGHYESESAFAMGVVGAINERTSISGAIGVAGGSEVGGRVGVAYVFGGK